MDNKVLHQILGEMQTMNSDMKELKTEVTSIKSDVAALKSEQQTTNERLAAIESKQTIMHEQTGKLTEYHSETMANFENLATKEDLAYFDKKITEHDRELFKIKQRA
ncbi:MAG TPA: hypothetical protein VK125_08455 [Bacillota bacterium]|nr:hypothetical protein [Bacillota bacterium]